MRKPHDPSDRALDHALEGLTPPQLDPLTRRAQLQRAEARLRQTRAPSSVKHYEPPLLVALAAMQLVWLVARVLAS
jgi:hypothetical protein